MAMLADSIDGVIGVDTHRDTLTAAAVTAIGGLLGHATAPTDAVGYRELLAFAAGQVPGRRCWAIEGAGGRPATLPPRAMRWTPSTSPATPSSRPIRSWCAGVGTAKRCGCC